MFIEVGQDANISYEVHGEDNSNTIIFLPGILGSQATFTPIVDKLKSKYRCITTEFCGHGSTTASGRVNQEDFSVENHAKDIQQIIEKLNIEKFNLAGLSFGSTVAIEVSKNNPQKIDNLILLAGLLVNNTTHYVNWNTFWAKCTYDIDLFTHMGIGLLFSETFLNNSPTPFESIKSLYEPLTDEHFRAFRMNLQSAIDYDVQNAFEIINKNGLIEETYWIHGEQDIIHPLHELKKYLTNGKYKFHLHTLNDTGHGIHAEAPNKVAELIDLFIS